MTLLIIIVTYLIGVAVALVCIAMVDVSESNTYDELPVAFAIISWLLPISLLVYSIGVLVCRGFEKIFYAPYDLLYEKFDKIINKRRTKKMKRKETDNNKEKKVL